MATLTLDRLSKSFAAIEVLHDISLTIEDGEFVVIVGPSGCGKSTLLRTIAGLEAVTKGTILIDDHEVQDKPASKRGLAMVFQSYALYPHKTVAQNMGFALHIAKRPKAEIRDRVNEVARILKLENLMDRRPKELSGGQRQRVAIGRAIVRQPKIFLFDEPLSNLDAALRSDMRVELGSLHKNLGATMIYVTHDQVEAMTLADKIIVMKDGYVQQIGSPWELYQKPFNKFVAEFIGSPRMNFIPVEEGRRAFAPNAQNEINPPRTAVFMGIRPEHIQIGTVKEGIGRFRVSLVEYLGGQSIIYGEFDTGPAMTVVVDGESNIESGIITGLSLRDMDCHYFDDRGQRL